MFILSSPLSSGMLGEDVVVQVAQCSLQDSSSEGSFEWSELSEEDGLPPC